jgi:ribosomal 50S subunit-associated protein YjgA (DUF615 family)
VTWEQTRIINDQQLALKKAHAALANKAEESRQLIMAFANAIGQACEQIERGYPHCAANRLRQLHTEIMKESRNDDHN